ncbi:MAG: hypothetical protein R8K48_10015 [Gallionella sp.]
MDRMLPQLFGESVDYQHLKNVVIDGKNYAICEVIHPHKPEVEHFYFDTSAYQDRAYPIAEIERLNLPLPDAPIPLSEFLPDSELALYPWQDKTQLKQWLAEITLVSKAHASSQIQRSVAAYYWDDHRLVISPVRDYTEDDIPVLHGFHFYKLFILHQLIHKAEAHDKNETETHFWLNTTKEMPQSGVDCIQFTPLTPFNFAHDVVNYTLWTHQLNAFSHPAECSAFSQTVGYGVRSNLFSLVEIRRAISDAHTDFKTQQILLGLL